MNQKKSLKEDLMEIFLRRSFIDCDNKKEELKKTFYHDLKLAGIFVFLLLIMSLLVLIFGL